MEVPLQNLQVFCSVGVWVCLPSSMSNLWLEQLKWRARRRRYGGPLLRYGAGWKDVWNILYVSSLGAFVGIARYVIHHLLYSPCRSSFRCCVRWLFQIH